MKKLFTILFALALLSVQAQELEVIGAAGDHNNNGNIQVSWTVGEIAVETYSNGTNVLTQGFHQSNYIISQIEDKLNNTANISLHIFPNPTSDLVTLELNGSDYKDLSFEVNDNNGKKLMTGIFNSNKENIDFSKVAPSIYYVRVYNNNGTYSDTYKIVKSQN